MSKQTFVMTPKNYPRPLEVPHAKVMVSGEPAIGSSSSSRKDLEAALRPGIAARASAPPRKPSAR